MTWSFTQSIKRKKGDIIRLCKFQGSMIEGEEDSKHGMGKKGRQAMFLMCEGMYFQD